MGKTRIPVSTSTRRDLRILKAKEDCRSYDELLARMVDERLEGGAE